MKDFPVFTTEYGIASLVLREIPYRGEAYITLRDSLEPEKLLAECVDFCRVCGADHIYASGHEMLETYPLHTAVLEMRGTANVNPDEVESLFPVTEATVSKWRSIYNEKMADVQNAATLTARDEKKLLASAGVYFVHRGGELLGIGWLEDGELLAVASVRSGAGRQVMNTLLSLKAGETVTLEVASTNGRAIRLYEKMGFLRVKERNRWYRVQKKPSV